jgi:glycosyltransferase involved in cell wall biosynthesis
MTILPSTLSSTSAHDQARSSSVTPAVPFRISVALCTYNGARFLAHQLDSIMAQTRHPDELVACDDGSTDETLAILEQFRKRASFPVRIVSNDVRLGSTKNFEQAIRLCAGELIATCDQDDFWLPEKLAISEAAFASDPSRGLVFANADVVDADLRSIGHQVWDSIHFGHLARRRVRRGHAFEVLLRQWMVTGATMMFRADYRPFVLPIPDIWVHDGWIAFIIGALAPVGMVERSTMKYRQHAAQQIGGKRLNWKEFYERAREVGPSEFRLACERFLLARQRLQDFASRVRDPRFFPMVDRKVEHQKRRLAISESPSRWQRVIWTLSELVQGGYCHYSPSCAYFLKDMIL